MGGRIGLHIIMLNSSLMVNIYLPKAESSVNGGVTSSSRGVHLILLHIRIVAL